jgi:hypothetical protein
MINRDNEDIFYAVGVLFVIVAFVILNLFVFDIGKNNGEEKVLMKLPKDHALVIEYKNETPSKDFLKWYVEEIKQDEH